MLAGNGISIPNRDHPMSDLQVTTGLVAVFDILGYQNFVDNNSVKDAAEKVLKAVAALETEIPELTAKTFYTKTKGVENWISSSKRLILSDTILFSVPAPPPSQKAKIDETQDDVGVWIAFLIQCIVLGRHMFAYGLPVRGAIGYGEFYVEQNCLFGRPIMDAYRKMQQLDFVGSVMLPDTTTLWKSKIIAHVKSPRFLGNFLGADYLAPLRGDTEEKLFVLNSLCRKDDDPDITSGDIRQTVLGAFFAHNKDVPESVMSKVRNTEKLLRFLKLKFPNPIS